MTGAWALFPEYKRGSNRTSVHAVKYVEIDWQTGRTIIVNKERHPYVPSRVMEEPKKRSRRKKPNEEETQ